MKQIILIAILLNAGLSGFSQWETPNMVRYVIKDVGFISIPDNMEAQAGSYRDMNRSLEGRLSGQDDKTSEDNEMVFQQKGLNDMEKGSFKTYVRVMVNTKVGPAGSFASLRQEITASSGELKEIGDAYRKNVEASLASTGMSLIRWNGMSVVRVNAMSAFKMSYVRRLQDKPEVVVNTYIFQNHDRAHILTLSCRVQEEKEWMPVFRKILESFTVTNIR